MRAGRSAGGTRRAALPARLPEQAGGHPAAIREASIWMQSFGQFEAVDLDAFEQFLEREFSETEAPPT